MFKCKESLFNLLIDFVFILLNGFILTNLTLVKRKHIGTLPNTNMFANASSPFVRVL